MFLFLLKFNIILIEIEVQQFKRDNYKNLVKYFQLLERFFL